MRILEFRKCRKRLISFRRDQEDKLENFLSLVEIMAGQFGKAKPADARRKGIVAVSTMIGALTMSRIVNDPELSAEIHKEAKKSLIGK